MSDKASVKIACASGFWGDTPTAVPQLVHAKNAGLDYIMFDYLSELTMSLLTAAKRKRPEMGYAPDFAKAVGPYLKDIKGKGIKLIANAGGINTSACVQCLKDACKKADVDLKIAQVSGDNMVGLREELLKSGEIKSFETGEPLPKSVHSMTAYFGAGPIVKALEMGADIVVTGRTTDSAMALGPLVHEFGWDMDSEKDLDKLAMGSLAGHIIECGGQATGGLFTDWQDVGGYADLGFPIVEVDKEAGSIVVSKPEGSGGRLTKETVAEQLLYEIGDPAKYILPDVTCDFTNVKMSTLQNGTVVVAGAKGRNPTPHFKVCSTYLDGFRGTSASVIAGGMAAAKGRKVADAIMERTRRILKAMDLGDFQRSHVSVIGSEDSFGSGANETLVREAVLWMAVQHRTKAAVEIWSREIASAGTGMAPGMCNMIGGRPKATPCLRLFSFLYPKKDLVAEVSLDGKTETYTCPEFRDENVDPLKYEVPRDLKAGNNTYFLGDLAFARSGDKGDTCNIGVIARHPNFLPYIKRALTPEAIGDYFSNFFEDELNASQEWHKNVDIYDVPGIDAINLVLRNSLGGGGMASLRPDPLGKSFGQRLLGLKVENVPDLDSIVQDC